jgi:hypothetical protein
VVVSDASTLQQGICAYQLDGVLQLVCLRNEYIFGQICNMKE